MFKSVKIYIYWTNLTVYLFVYKHKYKPDVKNNFIKYNLNLKICIFKVISYLIMFIDKNLSNFLKNVNFDTFWKILFFDI